ncbi:MAG TPA: proton-conducting transporter membrane subunit [Thauera sp.]|uniref:hydrogen gas-evolving membrane-bound hydrogenase subunit E n=1 Tax=Thauera sp. TaxID=1905334 RepID=UPI002C46957D|nr:hydrogen gas-evolving membrane-bound hydrogenase subunit E [Thauera sp.]HRP22947.1 proton-conducting transporter membrane subunit [Thauera sp.]HRP65769.1 proton-conducting transporter membrane subunit [Thauera sp.]
MFAGIALIAFAMLIAPLLARPLDDRAGWVLAIAPLTAFGYFLSLVPEVALGEVVTQRFVWVAALDVELAFRVDGLSLLFALLISGIGTLIVLYAGAYLSDHHHLGRFYAYLLGFMAAMLGLVLADDLIAMFVFWELTSVTSFLLISFQHDKADSRRSALQALLITGGGGLALLAGLILLGSVGGSWQFSGLSAEAIAQHAAYPAILTLVLIGAFTKSAQIPFHLWLPNAMAAPTPVSAYLHSATMVKAGVYLLARLNPALGGSASWSTILITIGAATALVGAVLAIRQTDLKRVLAYTTVTVLGQLTMLLGTNTHYGLQAFAIYLVAHAFYKAALFMAVGAVDHATGTRQISNLGGLLRYMPLTGFAVALAAFSNAGLPPFFGFIAKEFKYAGLIELGLAGWVTTAVMILTNALLLTAAGLVFVRTFLGKEGRYPRKPHEVSLLMWIGPMLLAVGGFVFGAFNNLAEVWLIDAAVQAVSSSAVPVDLYLWGGFTPALLASAITVALGVFFYLQRTRLRRRLSLWRVLWRVSGDMLWDRLLKRVFLFAGGIADRFQHGSLRQHISALVIAIAGFALIGLFASTGEDLAWPDVSSPLNLAAVVGCALAVAGAAAAAVMPGRVALIATLGASGLGLAMFFLASRAPDVAITQLMVETLTVIFLALVLRNLPPTRMVGSRKPAAKRFHAIVALVIGAVVTAMMLMTVSQPLPGDIARWYLDNSLPGGHGANVVNVILVDFRALDTLGEILVVGLAALAAANLLGSGKPGKTASEGSSDFASVLLRQGIRPLSALLALISLMLLWRGHNLPGGGFIGGLVGATAAVLLALAFGVNRARAVLRVPPAIILALGLACAAGAGVIGLLQGQPFLTGGWIFPGGLPLGTPLLFDVGVFLTVVGAVLHMLFRLLEREA